MNTIPCSVCTNANDILSKTCSNCQHELPSDRRKLAIFVAKLKLSQLEKNNENSSKLKEDIENLKTKIAEKTTRVVYLKEKILELQMEKLRLDHELTSFDDKDDEYSQECAQIQKTDGIALSLQTIPYINPSQFSIVKVMSGGPIYRLELGSYKGQSVVMKTISSNDPNTYSAILERFNASTARLAKLNGGDGTFLSLIGASNIGDNNPKVYLEYMDRGDLRQFLDRAPRSKLSWKNRVSIACNIAKGLKVLHGLDLMHRDLSSRHVLLDANMVAKLTGLSNAREIVFETMTQGVGDLRWSSPESIRGGLYSEKADIYSLGLIMIELDTHSVPYSFYGAKGEGILMNALFNATPGSKITQHEFIDSPDWYRKLALQCVDLDPENRPSAVEVVNMFHSQLRRMPSRDNELILPPMERPPTKIDLDLTIISARNLLDTQVMGTQDPFCKIRLGNHVAYTKYHNNGDCNPTWHQVFTFKDIHPVDDVLEINILNKNWLVDGQIGKSTIELEKTIEILCAMQTCSTRIPVFSNGEQRGDISVKFEYKGDLAQWLSECEARMESFQATRGSVHTMEWDEIQIQKVREILLPQVMKYGPGALRLGVAFCGAV